MLHLTEQQVLQCSPARLLEPPTGTLYCAVGADESPEFLRQNQLMQDAWGSHFVPRSVALPGLNHFSIVDALAKPGHDLHQMAQKPAGGPENLFQVFLEIAFGVQSG